eukprot:TRINITY_DN3184_c0_g1_i5.p1 TRINITY_DN3184_c0_g1~~TRINITY_DN3184_c0_g1_i5.p1  ORF type:complete len:167 (+),score=50.17 TRINITY_DN3184_c0_g1_i5:184-684(+)
MCIRDSPTCKWSEGGHGTSYDLTRLKALSPRLQVSDSINNANGVYNYDIALCSTISKSEMNAKEASCAGKEEIDHAVGWQIKNGEADSCRYLALVDSTDSEKNVVWSFLSQRNPAYGVQLKFCLLYTSDAADDLLCVDLGGRRIIKKKKCTILLGIAHCSIIYAKY